MKKPILRLNLANLNNLEMAKPKKNDRHERRKYPSIKYLLKIRISKKDFNNII